MKYIDLHCDTPSRLLYEGGNLKKNNFKVDINKLGKGNSLAQVFAFFIDAGECSNVKIEFEIMYKNFMEELQRNNDTIEIVRSLQELSIVEKKRKLGAFLAIEEGDVLEGKVENVQWVYDLGIRFITLTWNYKNKLGYPNYQKTYIDRGLKEKGIEIVKEMERVGIIVDASHLSDGGFYDLIRICEKPFVATHSNSRAIKDHPRNLTDDMIRLLADKGGVMGLNFCADFVGKNNITSIDDLIVHLKHIRRVGGIDVIALGSDFDGIKNEVEIRDCTEMYKLYDALKIGGFSEDEIEKIFYKNISRVMMETLK